jgi:TolB protein
VGTSIFTMKPDGTGLRRLTEEAGSIDFSPRWSPDGRRVLFSRSRFSTGGGLEQSDLFLVSADGRNEHRLTRTPASETTPDSRR